MKKLKIGILGAGKRMQDYYAPFLSHYKEKYDVIGFWNRNESKAKNVIDKFGYNHFTSIDELAAKCEALIIVVNSGVLTNFTHECLKYKLPIFSETPVWNESIVKESNKLNIPIAIAEQTAYLPSEMFKKILISEGKKHFGNVSIVMNDCRTFEYHGIAQLRNYIGFDKRPILVNGVSHVMTPPPYLDGNNVLQNHIENWDFGTIKFNSGQTAIYNFSSIGNRCQFRKPRSIRIYCDKGTISNNDNEFDINILMNDGSGKKINVDVEMINKDKTKSISTKIGDDLYQWNKKCDDLNDHQESLEYLFDNFKNSIINNTPLLYDSQQGWNDFKLLMAIRRSSQTNTMIRIT